MPDPTDRFLVFAYARGVEIVVEISGTAPRSGLTIPFLDARQVVGHINERLGYAFERVRTRVEHGILCGDVSFVRVFLVRTSACFHLSCLLTATLLTPMMLGCSTLRHRDPDAPGLADHAGGERVSK